jgi:hypothetical protein
MWSIKYLSVNSNDIRERGLNLSEYLLAYAVGKTSYTSTNTRIQRGKAVIC